MNDLIVKAAARALRRQAGERSVLAPECTLEGQVADMLERLLDRARDLEAAVERLEAVLEDHRQSNFCDYGCLDDEKKGAR